MKIMKVEIRKSKKEDLPKIWEVEKESREYHLKILPKKYGELIQSKVDAISKNEFIEGLTKSFECKSNIILVAEISGQIVGWIFSELGTWWGLQDNSVKTLWIDDLEVLKKYQRKGIAKRLLNEIEKKARAKGVKYGNITLNVKNKPAYGLYKKNGYDDFAIEMVKKF